MSIKSREFKEGEKAFNNLEPAKSNPYKYPCKKWFSWFYGHMHKAIIRSGSGERAYKLGREAFLRGYDISTCPYDKEYAQSDEWKHGWIDEYVEAK